MPIPLSSKKRLFTSNTSSEIKIASSAVESSNEIFPTTRGGNETNEPDISVEKRLFTSDTSSEINIASSAVESSNEIFPSTSGGNETDEPDITVESNVEMDQGKKVEDLEARLLQSEKKLAILRKKNEERGTGKKDYRKRTAPGDTLPVYFLSIASSPMRMLIFILAFLIMLLS